MKEALFIIVGLGCFFACLFFSGCSTQVAQEESLTYMECTQACAYALDEICPDQLDAYIREQII